MVKDSQEGRWMVFQATETLPLASSVNITVGPNTPSAEGPLKTTETQSFGFSIYSPPYSSGTWLFLGR